MPTNDGLGLRSWGAGHGEEQDGNGAQGWAEASPERKQVFVRKVQCDFRNDEWGGMMIPLLVEMMRNDDQ